MKNVMLVRSLALSVLLAAVPASTALAQSDAVPGADDSAEYFALGENEPVPGLAPGLAFTDLGAVRRVVEVRMTEGDEVMSGLLEFTMAERPAAAAVNGIGGFESAVFAYYDPERGAFKTIPVDMKGEVVGFTGSLSYNDGEASVHVHAIMSLPDGTTRAGHLVSAVVSPIMQIHVLEAQGSR